MVRKQKYSTPGNPEIRKYSIQSQVPDKPNSALLALRVDPKLLADIKSIDDWQSKVREKLNELIEDETAW